MPEGLRPIHPRPQLRRDWTSLDDDWDFALDPESQWRKLADMPWGRTIRVPFAPEMEASGIHDTGFYKACWYRRMITPPPDGTLFLLHFGAVDYEACVWANGQFIARHRGGYTPFTADLRKAAAGGRIELVVRAFDDPFDLAKPRGNQDRQLQPHSIWYPRCTGIWQPLADCIDRYLRDVSA